MTDLQKFSLYKESKDVDLRNQLVEQYLYMVEILIRKYLNKGVEYDDLYQVGAMALVSAVERFDPTKGFEFSSFATPTILGEIRKYFRDKEWSLKVPRRYKEIALKIPQAKEKLFEQTGHMPTPTEIAVFLGISSEDILHAMESSKAYDTKSLNETFNEAGEDGDNLLLEKFMSVEDTGYRSIELAEIIQKVVSKLNKNEAIVFSKRYVESKTQADIAEEMGVSQMTVSRIEKEIRNKFAKELQK